MKGAGNSAFSILSILVHPGAYGSASSGNIGDGVPAAIGSGREKHEVRCCHAVGKFSRPGNGARIARQPYSTAKAGGSMNCGSCPSGRVSKAPRNNETVSSG